ncbi:unnamed protein product [Hydatigera taeniaeformis]|uniref:LRRCT domain-containing protein n=1 Tax=Hydatigena taeniaeformis TaxID=6205 RepID=A0A0R3X6W7_HYDTA|nr:unnamed protein product [Hydatigera taeniaeformis]
MCVERVTNNGRKCNDKVMLGLQTQIPLIREEVSSSVCDEVIDLELPMSPQSDGVCTLLTLLSFYSLRPHFFTEHRGGILAGLSCRCTTSYWTGTLLSNTLQRLMPLTCAAATVASPLEGIGKESYGYLSLHLPGCLQSFDIIHLSGNLDNLFITDRGHPFLNSTVHATNQDLACEY